MTYAKKSEPFAGGPEWLAELLDVPLSTVYGWRLKNQGPPAYKIGRHLRYRRSEVDSWLAEQRDTSDRRIGTRR